MRIRIIAVAVAAVLAVAGVVVLVGAFHAAGQSAASGKDLVSVLVVKHEIPAGTSASDISGAIESESIPSAYVAAGAARTPADIDGKVSSVTLEPGEQLLASRFVTPSELAATGGTAAVPTGMQQVSIAIDPQRLAAGRIGVGDHVGVFVSLDATGSDPAETKLLLNDVLVTAVGTGTTASASGSGASGSSSIGGGTTTTSSVTGQSLVTFALSADDAQKLVYGAEFGHVWLSLQGSKATPATTGSVTRTQVAG